MSNTRGALQRELAEVAAQLGNDELALVVLVATRAMVGQRRYGLLAVESDRRDFIHEAVEEVTDGLFYVGAALLAARGVERPRVAGTPGRRKGAK
jgi:hypothetical protein